MAGAAVGVNEDFNDRQLHSSEYEFARKNAKVVAKKPGISDGDAEGRIVAEILRNSDKDTAEGTGGRHDYQVRSIIGCPNLNCKDEKNVPNYANPNYNSQYIAGNLDSYDRGLGQLPTGKTHDQLTGANVKQDPVGTTVAELGIIGLGYLTGGTATAVGVFGG